MHSKNRDLLLSCPFGLSRLAEESGNLEAVTGKELTGMFLIAKQRGFVSDFKSLWSRRRVTGVQFDKQLVDCSPPEEQNDTTTHSPGTSDVENGASFENCDNSTVANENQTCPNSPCTDPSPSPSPHVTNERLPRYVFDRLIFAGRDLPILLVGCYRPEKETTKICCYGGSQNGVRCFLTCWEYAPPLIPISND
jgi:hypothetical protein